MSTGKNFRKSSAKQTSSMLLSSGPHDTRYLMQDPGSSNPAAPPFQRGLSQLDAASDNGLTSLSLNAWMTDLSQLPTTFERVLYNQRTTTRYHDAADKPRPTREMHCDTTTPTNTLYLGTWNQAENKQQSGGNCQPARYTSDDVSIDMALKAPADTVEDETPIFSR
ncbi:hypothetical protein QQX98_007459 [Neonectria punicea]|uniref:Uncharacterized protein n=1 Tax=Neonectria punicea TaxID=979145 RepID=A0ABR1GY43_9HYPO